ncbi:MAG TPA: helix-turn-helix domain-containing protein [Dinghuibacter sp.]|uniref:AraC family transcriptional regulator n=1 Tax=Dinghuibacter sp. TaxID=2024697 RepID=UPI002C6308ED|nr:helix-turn-helix domain-containing protein [Dinghuibacter sp.]HTJ13665.1 helix-turn-helix domain-containing protein [Dinghuibacter sp.]
MRHQEFPPPEGLKDTIKCFWQNTRDNETRFEVLPDGYAEIIFHFGNGCSIESKEALHPLPSPFMMGLLNQPVVFHTKDRFEVIGIRCFPWTVFDLLGLPSGKDGVRAFEHPIAALQPTLNECVEAGKIKEALDQVIRYFEDLRSHVAIDSMLFKAGAAMRKANGALPVSQVASAAYATVRTLERNFKQASGHTVKDVNSLMRFEQVRNHLWNHPDTNLAGLAQELGYTDQSHLSREFKRFSGATPGAFARKSKRDRHDDFVAFVQA